MVQESARSKMQNFEEMSPLTKYEPPDASEMQDQVHPKDRAPAATTTGEQFYANAQTAQDSLKPKLDIYEDYMNLERQMAEA